MMIKITKKFVDGLPFTVSGQKFYRDPLIKGFGVRVGLTVKAYYAEKMVKGRVVRKTIGIHGQITTEFAKKQAQILLTNMVMGIDPFEAERKELACAVTLREVVERFFEVKKDLSENTIISYKNKCNRYISDWMDKPIKTISTDMVLKRHSKIGKENGEYAANYTMRALRSFFNFAINMYDHINENPVEILSKIRGWYREKRRQNIIKECDLPAFWKGIGYINNQSVGCADYITFLLMTGLRRSEASSLEWEEVSFKDRSFFVRGDKTKNHEDLELPLSDFLLEMLERRHKEGGLKVFNVKDGMVNYRIKEINERFGVAFTPHDLRRTFITIAESLDISAYAVKRMVNHKMGGDVTAGYIIPNVDRLRKPMQKITDYILLKAGAAARTPGKVVQLRANHQEG
jgi:integrase